MGHVPEADNLLITEYLAREKKRAKQNTYGNRRTALGWFNKFLRLNDLDVTEVDFFDVEDFATWLISEEGPNVADGTAKRYISAVSKFYIVLVRRTAMEEKNGRKFEAGVEANPVKDADLGNILHTSDTERTQALRTREDYFALTQDQMRLMVEHARAPRFRNQLVMKALGGLGCRPGELRNLRVEDVDLDAKKVKIRAEKTENNRDVYFNDGLQFYLRQWIHTYRKMYKYADTSPYLIVTNRSAQIGKRTLVQVVHEAAEDAGLQEVMYTDAMGRKRYKVTCYAFRHGFATAMKDKVDPSVLKDLMGHEQVETTLKYYVQNTEETIRDAGELGPDI